MILNTKALKGTLKNGQSYRIGIQSDGSFVTLTLYFRDHGPLCPTYWHENTFKRLYAKDYRTYAQAFKMACDDLKNEYSINLLS